MPQQQVWGSIPTLDGEPHEADITNIPENIIGHSSHHLHHLHHLHHPGVRATASGSLHCIYLICNYLTKRVNHVSTDETVDC